MNLVYNNGKNFVNVHERFIQIAVDAKRVYKVCCVSVCTFAHASLYTDNGMLSFPVASLGWVTSGAATEGVTPLFFSQNLATFFWPSLSLSLSLFLPVRPRFSTILCKFAHNFFSFGCHPPGWCHPGRSAPSPSDATRHCGVVRYFRLRQSGSKQQRFAHVLLRVRDRRNPSVSNYSGSIRSPAESRHQVCGASYQPL